MDVQDLKNHEEWNESYYFNFHDKKRNNSFHENREQGQ